MAELNIQCPVPSAHSFKYISALQSTIGSGRHKVRSTHTVLFHFYIYLTHSISSTHIILSSSRTNPQYARTLCLTRAITNTYRTHQRTNTYSFLTHVSDFYSPFFLIFHILRHLLNGMEWFGIIYTQCKPLLLLRADCSTPKSEASATADMFAFLAHNMSATWTK